MSRLNKGDILHSAGDEYRILDYLGEGLTARVYQAERLTAAVNNKEYPIGSPVALKVLQPGLPDDIRRNFRDEADLIAELSQIERASGMKQSLIPGLVERFTGSAAEQEFLAMEFIQGTPLDRLVQEGGPLDEQLALHVAGQVLTVLELLHTRLFKTYTDFQLQNVWLLPDSRDIKVMDWNHVSRKREPLPAEWIDADLRRMGAYLYQILTGKGAFQTGETGHALAARAGDRWEAISTGARTIIRRALDPNPARRFTSAAAFREAVKEAATLWATKPDDVVDEAQSLMRPVTKAYADGAYLPGDELERAAVWVDMAGRLHPGDALVKNWTETIWRVTDDVSGAWGSGRQLLLADQYQEAAAVWRAEATSWGRADLWRRVMVAETAAELGKTGYAPLAGPLNDAVAAMNREDWPAARELFNTPPLSGARAAALASLSRETDAQLDYLRARLAFDDQRWADAARDYGNVDRALSGIAYADTLRAVYGWDKVGELAAEAERQTAEEARGDVQTGELADALREDLNQGLSRVEVALRDRPNSPSIIRLLENEAKRRPPEEACRLLFVALAYGAMPADQEARLRAAYADARKKLVMARAKAEDERLRQEKEALEEQKRLEEEAKANRVRQAVAAAQEEGRWGELEKLLGETKDAWPEDDVERARLAFAAAAVGTNARLAAEIAAALDRVDPDGAEERRQALVEQGERIAQAGEMWTQSLPAQAQEAMRGGRYDEARAIINDALPLFAADEARRNSLLRYREHIGDYESLRKELAGARGQLKDNRWNVDDAERAAARYREKLAALNGDVSDGDGDALQEEIDALAADIAVRRARLDIEEGNAFVGQRNLNEAAAAIGRAQGHLKVVPDRHPHREELVARLEHLRAQLAKAQKGGDNRTPLERNAKQLLAVLGAVALILALGLGWGLWSAGNARRTATEAGETAVAAGTSLAAAQAENTAARGTLAVLQAPTGPNVAVTQTVAAIETQAALATQALLDNESIRATAAAAQATAAAAQATPAPLPMTASLAGAAPVPSQLGQGVGVFYDAPTALTLTAPAGWGFVAEEGAPARLTDGVTAWDLTLLHSRIVSDSVAGPVTTTFAVPAAAVTIPEGQTATMIVDFSRFLSPLAPEVGQYSLSWAAAAADGRRLAGPAPLLFEIVAPPTVTVTAGRTYRTMPIWDGQYRVSTNGGFDVEVLGKIDLQDATDEDGNTPPTPDFLMVRHPGTREIFWLPSWNAAVYGVEPDWGALLAKLPEVTAPTPPPAVEE